MQKNTIIWMTVNIKDKNRGCDDKTCHDRASDYSQHSAFCFDTPQTMASNCKNIGSSTTVTIAHEWAACRT
eukprot:15014002-Ditylum_brightwellii.AAC.1